MMREPGDPFDAKSQDNKTNPSYPGLETSKYLSKALGGKGEKPEVTTESAKEILSIKEEIERLQKERKDDKKTKDRIEWLKGMLAERENAVYK